MAEDYFDDDARQHPKPPPPEHIPNRARGVLNGTYRQSEKGKPPVRAITLKGEKLRRDVTLGPALGREPDWAEIYARYVDLWQEARLVIWRAKRAKAGLSQIDPKTGVTIATFVADDRTVLQAIDVTKGVLDSMIKLRRDLRGEAIGLPRWAIRRIESALDDHPSARDALLSALAKGEDEK